MQGDPWYLDAETRRERTQSVLIEVILFLQTNGMYDEFVAWRTRRRREDLARRRDQENRITISNLQRGNSNEFTSAESSETSSSDATE